MLYDVIIKDALAYSIVEISVEDKTTFIQLKKISNPEFVYDNKIDGNFEFIDNAILSKEKFLKSLQIKLLSLSCAPNRALTLENLQRLEASLVSIVFIV